MKKKICLIILILIVLTTTIAYIQYGIQQIDAEIEAKKAELMHLREENKKLDNRILEMMDTLTQEKQEGYQEALKILNEAKNDEYTKYAERYLKGE